MSLKGYEWLKDNKVIMNFTFKYLELTLLEDVTKKELEEFKNFLKEKNEKILKIDYNNHKIKDQKQSFI